MDTEATKDCDASGRRRLLLLACALVALLGAVAGCGDSKEDAAKAARERARAVAHAREMALGRRVFATHCETCHTIAGKHYTRPIIEFEAPNLDEVRMKRRYVEGRVGGGGPAMASFTDAIGSPRRVRALVTYVTETAGSKVVDDGDQPPDELAEGKAVFAEHCAGCHAIEGRAMNGRPIYPGNDFTLEKPSEAFVIKRMTEGVLVEQPVMPSFRGKLTDAEMRAVARYVTAVANEGRIAPQPQ